MKKFAAAIGAMILVVAGYFFGNFSGMGNSHKNVQTVAEIPEQLQKIQKEGLGPNKFINAYVIKVTDGDTFEVTYKGESYKVRLLDVDTPESVKQGVPVQEYAKEASTFTRDMILNKPVKLLFEKGLRDRYGRLLAHVILKDDTYLNAVLVRNGFARVEIVSPNSTHADYFYQLQQKAIEEKQGLWGLPEDKQPFIKEGNTKNYKPRYRVDEKAS